MSKNNERGPASFQSTSPYNKINSTPTPPKGLSNPDILEGNSEENIQEKALSGNSFHETVNADEDEEEYEEGEDEDEDDEDEDDEDEDEDEDDDNEDEDEDEYENESEENNSISSPGVKSSKKKLDNSGPSSISPTSTKKQPSKK